MAKASQNGAKAVENAISWDSVDALAGKASTVELKGVSLPHKLHVNARMVQLLTCWAQAKPGD